MFYNGIMGLHGLQSKIEDAHMSVTDYFRYYLHRLTVSFTSTLSSTLSVITFIHHFFVRNFSHKYLKLFIYA